MNTLTVTPQFSTLYNTVAELSLQELDSLMLQIKKMQYKHFPMILPKEESELLKKINAGLPAEIHQRYRTLRVKRQKETLTETEHKELISITETIEEFDVQCLQWLIQLAKLRNITLDQLTKQLGLTPKVFISNNN